MSLILPTPGAWRRIREALLRLDQQRPDSGAVRPPASSGASATIAAEIIVSRTVDPASGLPVPPSTAGAIRQHQWRTVRLGANRVWIAAPLTGSLRNGDPWAVPAYATELAAPVAAGTVVQMRLGIDLAGNPAPWFESPTSGQAAYVGRITARTLSGGVNALYSAEAVDDATIAVVNVAPINRVIPVSVVDWLPAAIGDRCILLVEVDGGQQVVRLVQLTERLATHVCTGAT
jgi:hypothetical protein